jgi:hypothetical protein
MTTNYTKQPYIIANGRKIFRKVIKCTNIFHSKAHKNLPKLGFLCLTINHLATPIWNSNRNAMVLSPPIKIGINVSRVQIPPE